MIREGGGRYFSVKGSLSTDGGSYIVLLSDRRDKFFAVSATPESAGCVEAILARGEELAPGSSVYLTMLSMMRALPCRSTRVVVTLEVVDGNVFFLPVLEVVQANELGLCVARVPMILTDACALSAAGSIPFIVFETPGLEFLGSVEECYRDKPDKIVMGVVLRHLIKREIDAAMAVAKASPPPEPAEPSQTGPAVSVEQPQVVQPKAQPPTTVSVADGQVPGAV